MSDVMTSGLGVLRRAREKRPVLFLALAGLVLFGVLVWQGSVAEGSGHFALLAASFLEGHLYFSQELSDWGDTVVSGGRHYWPLGPFPAILLVPFVGAARALGLSFGDVNFHFSLTAVVFGLCFLLARRLNYSWRDSLFWALAFYFGSMFIGVALMPSSWYFAHVLTSALLFLAFLEYLGTKRPWVIGIILGAVAATRLTAAAGILFFALDILLRREEPLGLRLRRLVLLSVPFVLALALLGVYNYARFGDPLEQGYSNQLLIEALTKAREYGLVSVVHIPGNLYYALLSLPLPVFRDGISHVFAFPFLKVNWWGMSIFFTSPYLAYLFLLRYRERFAKLLIITISVIAALVFSYYGIGFRQFGYRYALDFMPFVFFLFMSVYRAERQELSRAIRVAILGSTGINLYLLLTSLALYPYG